MEKVYRGEDTSMETHQKIAPLVGSFLSWLFGGIDFLFQTLVIFVLIDYISGVAAAWIRGEVSSSQGLKGITKKSFILLLVIVADKIDTMLGGSDFWRNAVLWSLIINETFSILENGGRMGIKIPGIFRRALALLEEKDPSRKDEDLR
jgi:toxin secretion/phage lysis holin